MDENKEIIRHLARIINSAKFDELNEVLAPTYVRHDPNPLMKDIGREEYKQAFLRLRNAFPDAQWTLEEILSDNCLYRYVSDSQRKLEQLEVAMKQGGSRDTHRSESHFLRPSQ